MSTKRLFLQFFRDKTLETQFQTKNNHNLLHRMRIAGLLGFGLYALFILVDSLFDPSHFSALLTIRLCVIGVGLILYFLAFPFPQLVEICSAGLLIICQLGHFFLMYFGQLPLYYHTCTTAIVIVFMFGFPFLFSRVLVMGTSFLIFFMILALTISHAATMDILISFLTLAAIVFAGLMGTFSKENSTRMDFLSSLQLVEEKRKSENLLLNILPEHIVNELRENGTSEPARYSSSTIMFTDFVDFSKASEVMSAGDLVNRLDGCFFLFDDIGSKYSLERLKTIGDSYMTIGGVPIPHSSHALDTCLAALEILNFNSQMMIVSDTDNPFWNIRIGINSGPVIGGVVGKTKFTYDVWGTAVNIAARLEAAAIPGTINLGRSTWELVKDYFEGEYRGAIDVKNTLKIEMYILRRLKPEYASDDEGYFPNQKLLDIRSALASG